MQTPRRLRRLVLERGNPMRFGRNQWSTRCFCFTPIAPKPVGQLRIWGFNGFPSSSKLRCTSSDFSVSLGVHVTGQMELRFLTPETYAALAFVHPVAQKHPQNKLNTSFDRSRIYCLLFSTTILLSYMLRPNLIP